MPGLSGVNDKREMENEKWKIFPILHPKIVTVFISCYFGSAVNSFKS